MGGDARCDLTQAEPSPERQTRIRQASFLCGYLVGISNICKAEALDPHIPPSVALGSLPHRTGWHGPSLGSLPLLSQTQSSRRFWRLSLQCSL